MVNKAVVIGAGIGGIATALRLRKKGFDVTLLEANKVLGGKLGQFHIGAYRFDKGPSLFTLPHLVTELFELFDKEPDSYFAYKKLPDAGRYFWEDGTKFTAHSHQKLFETSFLEAFGSEETAPTQHLKVTQIWYSYAGDIFLNESLHKTSTWLSEKARLAYLNIHKLPLFGSMNDLHKKRFKNPKVVQLFNRYATYNGSNPYQAPAMLAMIPHIELNKGVYFPTKGMRSIVDALVKLAKEVGIKIHCNQRVTKIDWHKNKARAVHTQTTRYPCDILINNADIFPFYKHLVPEKWHPKETLRQERSSSAFIWYLPVNNLHKKLGVHNILFSKNYREEFEHLFEKKSLYDDPTVYIHISSKANPQDAPKQGENWFVMINVPATKDFSSSAIHHCKKAIISKCKNTLGIDLSPYEKSGEHWMPTQIAEDTSSYLGALYGSSSNSKLAAFKRHPNFSKHMKNVYFVGGSVHPGGGIPLCLKGANIVSKLIPSAI